VVTTARHAEASRDSLRHEVAGDIGLVLDSCQDIGTPKLHGRRRSTVRFRNVAPGQSHNSNQQNVPVGTNGVPRWKISTVSGGDQDSRRTASAWQSAIEGALIMYRGHTR
jgi:hypothetical protein